MNRVLPPLDMHAHIDPGVKQHELEDLGAVVFAVCRTPSEFARTQNRTDQITIWGLGCHPDVAEAHSEFDVDSFRQALATTSFVGEVGLDGRSRIPMELQKATLNAVLKIVAKTPRLVSLHSNGATEQTLEALELNGSRGAILHWWLGSPEQTNRAVELGCYFSVNYAMVDKVAASGIPLSRILIETDHPHGDRRAPAPRRPGSIQVTEKSIAYEFGVTTDDLRQQQWQNFSNLVDQLDVQQLMPNAVQKMLLYARGSNK